YLLWKNRKGSSLFIYSIFYCKERQRMSENQKKPLKLVVVGGVAGGASAAARVRRLDEKAEIVMFEKGRHVSFSNCCLPYHLSGTIADSEDLVLMTPEKFRSQYNIDARTDSEVTGIDRDRKCVTVKNLLTGETYEESFDKLVLSPGANPIFPSSIEGIERENVYAVRNVEDIRALKAAAEKEGTDNIAVVGGGFIGI